MIMQYKPSVLHSTLELKPWSDFVSVFDSFLRRLNDIHIYTHTVDQ